MQHLYLYKDYKLNCKPITNCNLVRICNEMLDLLMYEKFAEKAYDTSEAHSTEDRIVLKKYEKSI